MKAASRRGYAQEGLGLHGEIGDASASIPPGRQETKGIRWISAAASVFLCCLAMGLVFPKSPFFGLSMLGLGLLWAGSALGRE
jgi:hypothetical protein